MYVNKSNQTWLTLTLIMVLVIFQKKSLLSTKSWDSSKIMGSKYYNIQFILCIDMIWNHRLWASTLALLIFALWRMTLSKVSFSKKYLTDFLDELGNFKQKKFLHFWFLHFQKLHFWKCISRCPLPKAISQDSRAVVSGNFLCKSNALFTWSKIAV